VPTALILKTVLEITVLGYLLYRLILLAKETRAFRLLRGMGVILLFWGATVWGNLGVLKAIFEGVDMPTVIVVTVLVLFTPEIKEVLARLGGRAPFGHSPEERQFLTEIVDACDHMAQSKTGALIVLQRADGLADIIGTGVQLNAEVTSAFLEQVFYKDTPLHDGALIIAKGRCAAARCRLPNSSQLDMQTSAHPLGLRHRAGLGLAEVRDAVTVIVSEERGQISYCERGTLERSISPERLRELLTDAFTETWKWRGGQLRTPLSDRVRSALTLHPGTKFAGLALAAAVWCVNTQTVSTNYRIDFRPPTPSDYSPELVLVTNQKDLNVENARIRGGNLELARLLVGQFLNPDHMRNRFEIMLTGSAIEAESDHWKERCLVRDPKGELELLEPETPGRRRRRADEIPQLAVVVKLDVLETLVLDNPYQVPINTTGTLPETYRAEGTPFLEHSGTVLRFFKGNRKALENQLKLAQDLVRPLDLTGRREPFKRMPVRVRLPANPPEVRELYHRRHKTNYFKATLTYGIVSDRPESDPLARRKAEVVKLEQEAVARKTKFEEQSQLLESARQKLLADGGRESVTLQGYATVLADRETARAREKLTERQLAEAKKVRDELTEQDPVDPVAIRLEEDAIRAVQRDLGYQSDLVKLHAQLIKGYTERIQPVLDLQQETELLLATGWEPSAGPPPAGTVPALEARLGELNEQISERQGLSEPERTRFEEEGRKLVVWTSRPDRMQVLNSLLGSLTELDPVDPEFAKQAPALQGRVRNLLIELKELRGLLEALWVQEEGLEDETFLALSRARLILGQTKARVARLRAEIALRTLELERRHLLAWIGELKSTIANSRKTFVASVHFLVDEAGRNPAVLSELAQALPQEARTKLSADLVTAQNRTQELIEGVVGLETELEAIQAQIAERRARLRREHVFLSMRMESPRVGKALGRENLLPDLSAEENQLLDTPPSDAQLRVLSQRLGSIDGEPDGDLEFERDRLYGPLYASVTDSEVERASLPVLLNACREVLLSYRSGVLGDESSGLQQLLAQLNHALQDPAPPPDGSK
jgi:diadenylate cyclase